MTQAMTVGEVDQRVARNPLPEVQLPEVGRLRLGGPKLPNRPGQPLDFFRATAPIREDLEELARVYGDPATIQPWDSPDGKQWQTVLTQAVIHIALPPYSDTLIGPRYEVYNAGHYMTRYCDGRACWMARAPKRDAKGRVTEAGAWEPKACQCDPEEPECAQVTRLKVVVLGVPAHGVWRVECHGKYAARHWPAQVRMAQDLTRDGRPVPATIRIESKTGRSAVFGKSNYKVPVLRLEEAFVLTAPSVPQIAAPAQPGLPPPTEPVPPEDEAIDAEYRSGENACPAPPLSEAESESVAADMPSEDTTSAAPASSARTTGPASSAPAGNSSPSSTPASSGTGTASAPDWRAVGYADAMANKALYSRELTAFVQALGRHPKPDGYEDMTLGAIVQKAVPAPVGARP